MAEQSDQVGPVPVGFEHDEREEPAVGGPVEVDDRVGHLATVALGHPIDPKEPGAQGRGARGPHGGGEERVVHDHRLACALPMEEGRGDPAGDRETADDVAKGRPGLRDRVASVVGVADDVCGSAAPPEGAAVVAPAFRLGSPLAVARSPHVDDVRIGGADVLDVDPELTARLGAEVGEEHVRGLAELEQDAAALLCAHVEADAPFAPVGELHHVGDPAGPDRDHPHGREPPLRIAGLGVLDLDDVGPPFGQDRAGHRHVGPGGDLHHPDTLHDSSHGSALRRSARFAQESPAPAPAKMAGSMFPVMMAPTVPPSVTRFSPVM